jgi:HSP20 family protein
MQYNIIPRRFWPSRFFEDWDEDDLMPFSGNNAVSVYEDDKNIFVEAALPGIDPKDIDITFDKGMLWIKGEMMKEEEDKKKKFYQKASSSFSYRVSVPGEVDMKKEPEADYKNGIMTVKFAKSPEEQPKKIVIKSK